MIEAALIYSADFVAGAASILSTPRKHTHSQTLATFDAVSIIPRVW